jgi:hypothetical protein
MCLLNLLAAVAPRLALAYVWIFTDYVDRAFNTWFWPTLGLVFAPWTTLMYVAVWTSDGLTVGKWILVGAAACIDVISWSASSSQRRYRYRRTY